jgi:hypothetical protein
MTTPSIDIQASSLAANRQRGFGLPVWLILVLAALSAIDRATLQAKVQNEFKVNRYVPTTQTLTLTTPQTRLE